MLGYLHLQITLFCVVQGTIICGATSVELEFCDSTSVKRFFLRHCDCEMVVFVAEELLFVFPA